jgi:hypothetical protein
VTFTDEQLWAAVRSAGRDGQSFTTATLRECLGMTSTKRNELQQFRDRFRAFRLAAGEEIEKVGKSAYRLKPAAGEVERPVESVADVKVDEAVEGFAEVQVAKVEAVEVEAVEVEAVEVEAAEVEAVEVEAVEVEAARVSEVEHAVPSADDEPTEELIEVELIAVPDDREQPIERPSVLEHPVAVADMDLGFGEPLESFAADSGELAANHVIFSAWPEERAAAESGGSAEVQSEKEIEAEVRELVSGAGKQSARESLFAQAEQAVMRTWRDSGHWLGRRFSQLFNRN